VSFNISRIEIMMTAHDTNAGQNILYLGVKDRTGGPPGLACEGNRVTGRKQEEDGYDQVASQVAA